VIAVIVSEPWSTGLLCLANLELSLRGVIVLTGGTR
jgi:hypothetical protein